MEIISLPVDMANYYRVLFTGPGDGAGAKAMEADDPAGADATELRYECPAVPGGLGFTVQVLADQCAKRWVTVEGATLAVGDRPRYASAPALPSPGTVRKGAEEPAAGGTTPAAPKPKPAPPAAPVEEVSPHKRGHR